MNIKTINATVTQDPGEAAAFEAGRDYSAVGANGQNCHFRHFATVARKNAWERGRDCREHYARSQEASNAER